MTQRDPSRYPVMCYVPIETLVKIKTEIEGRRVRIKSPSNRRATEKTRKMGLADFLVEQATEAVKDVVPSRAAVAWGKEKLSANRTSMNAEGGEERRADYRKRHLTLQMRRYYAGKIKGANEKIAKLKAERPQTERTRAAIEKLRRKLVRFKDGYGRFDAECRQLSDGRRHRKD